MAMAAPSTTSNVKKVSNSNISSYISDDISFSILSKLPVKSLKRFSCVRKSWSVVIENPNFMTMYRNNLISKSHPLYDDDDDDDDDACLILNQYTPDNDDDGYNVYLISGEKFEEKVILELPPSFQIKNFGVIQGSVNGILCIYDFHCFQTKPVLWNPATEEILVTPPGHAEIKPVELVTFILIHGFGYDHVEDDYKVIQHVFYGRPSLYENFDLPNPFWEIYSLRSNSWRKTDLDMPIDCRDYNANGAYFNGVCHWVAEINDLLLVSFNLCNEVHFTTPLLLEDYFGLEVNLTVLNGNVATIINCKRTTTFQISILGEFGVKESWIRLLDIELLPIEHHIGTGDKGNIFFAKENKELVCFDLTTGLIEEIGLGGDGCWCQMVIYKKNFHRTLERNN